MRPDDIGKIFGQDHIQELLINWLEDTTKVPPSLLISGPYGTGKTTIAKLLASRLAQSDTDITEINAANARGIDDARQWAEAARFSPLGLGSKVFIIDELHQMTTAAQSALLKVIEEPPHKIHFFLCTTEPSRLLPTIRSRCTHIELRLLSEIDTTELLAFNFQGKLSEEIMIAIHKKSGGHARDAVKIAEMAVLTRTVSVADLNRNVGYGYQEIEAILLQILNQKISWHGAVKVLNQITDEQILSDVVNQTIDRAVAEGVPEVVLHYKDFLEVKVWRTEWKITAHQQALFFATKMLGNVI